MDLGVWPFACQICIKICQDLNFLWDYLFQVHFLVGTVFIRYFINQVFGFLDFYGNGS